MTQGPFLASAGAGTGWTNPGNVTLDDDVNAVNAFGTNWHQSTFGSLSFHPKDQIVGITAEIEVRTSSPLVGDAFLGVAYNLDGTANPTTGVVEKKSVALTTVYQVLTFGGPLDLWGLTAIKGIDMGSFRLLMRRHADSTDSQQRQIDYTKITIDYLPASSSSADGFGDGVKRRSASIHRARKRIRL